MKVCFSGRTGVTGTVLVDGGCSFCSWCTEAGRSFFGGLAVGLLLPLVTSAGRSGCTPGTLISLSHSLSICLTLMWCLSR